MADQFKRLRGTDMTVPPISGLSATSGQPRLPVNSLSVTRAARLVSEVCMVYLVCCIGLGLTTEGRAQGVLSGRLLSRPPAGAESGQEGVPMTEIRLLGNLSDPTSEPRGFRTWEMAPAGWFRLSGPAGRYALLFSEPAHYMPPIVRTNIWLDDGQLADQLRVAPEFAYAQFAQQVWDTQPAESYFQPFVANGPHVTQVGIKLATDGVDGPGPLSTELVAAIHEVTDGGPEQWQQIGPDMPLLAVDCGGPKSYAYSAGWNSGEVPVVAGRRYAVRWSPRDPARKLQAFWAPVAESTSAIPPRPSATPASAAPGDAERLSAWRRVDGQWESTDHQLWTTVACTGDELLIPVNKRVHQKFGEFAGSARTWTQTYVAQGHALAGVVLYAAVSGAQPPLSRQRVELIIHEGGPEGPVIHRAVAVGEGHYTGDASWGIFGRVFAPSDVRLNPGTTYGLEFTSLESEETVGGFVNIKGQRSDGRAAFNPYRKHPLDAEPSGTAFRHGHEACDFDLDLQVLEYVDYRSDWEESLRGPGRLRKDQWVSWRRAKINAAANTTAPEFGPWQRSDAGPMSGTTGELSASEQVWSQVVSDLNRGETYRLAGRMQATWPADVDHRCQVGIDPTGQSDDPLAPTIRWFDSVRRHHQWQSFLGPAVRPVGSSVSVWLRAASAGEERFPFRAEFDAVGLFEQNTAPPRSPISR
ncbi:MAG: hypothetical protein U0795_09805 [Pirellulales bacterium]